MTNWIETYRGTVPPWECDVTEHFRIAYYFTRLQEAEPNLADALGLGERLRAGSSFQAIRRSASGRCWNNDRRRSACGLRRARRRRVRSRP
jgi:hypothetical protein